MVGMNLCSHSITLAIIGHEWSGVGWLLLQSCLSSSHRIIECLYCFNTLFYDIWRLKAIVGNIPHIQVLFPLFERMVDLDIYI